MNEQVLLFKALSDRNRLRIVSALIEYDELCACQITELLTITSATSSRHLGVLIQSGLIQSRKEGRWVYYSLNSCCASFDTMITWIKAELKNDEDAQKDREELKKIVAEEPADICRRQRGEKCCL